MGGPAYGALGKPSPPMLASWIGLRSSSSCFTSKPFPTNAPGKGSERSLTPWAPARLEVDPRDGPGSWLWLGPTKAVNHVGSEPVNARCLFPFLSLPQSPCNFSFQIKLCHGSWNITGKQLVKMTRNSVNYYKEEKMEGN